MAKFHIRKAAGRNPVLTVTRSHGKVVLWKEHVPLDIIDELPDKMPAIHAKLSTMRGAIAEEQDMAGKGRLAQ